MDLTHTALMSDRRAVISPKVKVAAMNLIPRGTALVSDSRATVSVLLSEETDVYAYGDDLQLSRFFYVYIRILC